MTDEPTLFGTATVSSDGSIRLPKELLRAKGWTTGTWLEVRRVEGDGIRLLEVPNPSASDVIRGYLETCLAPLGDGEGQSHSQKLFRWKTRSGEVIVNESTQPNIWLRKAAFDRLQSIPLDIEVQSFIPGDKAIGFHSNVYSTSGLKGEELTKLRVGDASTALELVRTIISQLGSIS